MSLTGKYKEKINEYIFKDGINYKHQNLLIYGLDEYCESYFLKKILESLYGELDTKKVDYEIDNYNKSNIVIKQSEYHIEFNPTNSGSDRYALISLIKDFGKSQMVNIVLEGTKNTSRTIIINKIDDLNYYCQASLRRNMEKYSNITNFILISSNLSKVTEPIRSRCCLITIPKLDIDRKSEILGKFYPKNKINVNNSLTDNLLEIDIDNLGLGKVINLENYIINLLKLSNSKFNENLIKKVKKLIYDLYISNYSLDSILLELNNKIMERNIEDDIKYDIMKYIIECNININLGKRYLIHLENLVIKIFKILKNENINI